MHDVTPDDQPFLLLRSTPAEHIAAIEGVQPSAGTNGLGDLTLDELMERFNVPGVSVAVIRDFGIHWEKS